MNTNYKLVLTNNFLGNFYSKIKDKILQEKSSQTEIFLWTLFLEEVTKQEHLYNDTTLIKTRKSTLKSTPYNAVPMITIYMHWI